MTTRLQHMLALLALCWFYVGVLALAFWAFGLSDCRATMAAFGLVTIIAVFWAEGTYDRDISDESDEAGA